jgi:putative membrane protein
MSIPHNTANEPSDAIAAVQPRPTPISPPTAEQPLMVPTRRVPRTRTSATWIGICAAALAVVALIIFMMQNTANVEVTFLWMHGTLPLALALLIAGVGVTILAMIVGTLRITQLRRLFARRSRESHQPDTSGPTS